MKFKQTTPDGLRLTILLLVITVIILFVQNLRIMGALREVAHRIPCMVTK